MIDAAHRPDVDRPDDRSDAALQKAMSGYRDLRRSKMPNDYLAILGEISGFIHYNLSALSAAVNAGPQSRKDVDGGSETRLHDLVGRDWLDLLSAANRVFLGYVNETPLRRAIGLYTQQTFTPIFLSGPSWARSFLKPLGYPGDFQVMNYMYDGNPVGPDASSRFLHLLGLSAGQLIPSRLITLIDLIVTHPLFGGSTAPSIVSLGSGPARELEMLAARLQPDRRFSVTLVDTEPQAHAFAHANIARLGLSRVLTATSVQTSFMNIVKQKHIDDFVSSADIVYSSGLIDYFSGTIARSFLARLYAKLKPGGRIIICNVNDEPSGAIWVMEAVLDWSLYFRSRADMAGLASDLRGARVEIHDDPSMSVYCLSIDKPLGHA